MIISASEHATPYLRRWVSNLPAKRAKCTEYVSVSYSVTLHYHSNDTYYSEACILILHRNVSSGTKWVKKLYYGLNFALLPVS